MILASLKITLFDHAYDEKIYDNKDKRGLAPTTIEILIIFYVAGNFKY